MVTVAYKFTGHSSSIADILHNLCIVHFIFMAAVYKFKYTHCGTTKADLKMPHVKLVRHVLLAEIHVFGSAEGFRIYGLYRVTLVYI